MTSFWTDARIERLKELWSTSLTTPQIAADLGTSKGSVIGKAGRLQLPRRNAADYWRLSCISNYHTTVWNEERCKILRDMREAGSPNYLIARHLGLHASTIQKGVRLLDLPRREPNSFNRQQKGPRGQQSYYVPRPPRAHYVTSLPFVCPDNPIAMLDLQRYQCRWPVADEPYRFCGATQVDNHSYCEEHCRLAYEGTSRKPGGVIMPDLKYGRVPLRYGRFAQQKRVA